MLNEIFEVIDDFKRFVYLVSIQAGVILIGLGFILIFQYSDLNSWNKHYRIK